jgi:ribonucleoside-diphosphate reductase beta chain
MTNKLKLTDTRNFYKPFNYPWAYDAFVQSEQMHWLWTEVSMLEDTKDWRNRLSSEEQEFLTKIFRFFTQGDIDVSGAYVNNYLPVFPQPEIRMMLSSFAAREAIHVAAYSHLIETLGMPESTYNEFLEYAEMAEKHDYFKDLQGDDDLPAQIAGFSAFTEGMQLFSSFIMLLNFTRHGKMRGMGQIIAWSIADETLHTESMIKLFRTYVQENRGCWNDELKAKIYAIAEKMVYLEDQFIDLAFGVSEMENLTRDEVKHYIRYICDRRLIALGMKGIFKVKQNPLEWVDGMLGVTHTNFFENKSVDYAKGALSGGWGDVWGAVDEGK